MCSQVGGKSCQRGFAWKIPELYKSDLFLIIFYLKNNKNKKYFLF